MSALFPHLYPLPCPSHLHHQSGQSLLSGGGLGGERGRGLWDSGCVVVHGPTPHKPLPSGPAGRLRPLLLVCHVDAVCHLRPPGTAGLSPPEDRKFRSLQIRLRALVQLFMVSPVKHRLQVPGEHLGSLCVSSIRPLSPDISVAPSSRLLDQLLTESVRTGNVPLQHPDRLCLQPSVGRLPSCLCL